MRKHIVLSIKNQNVILIKKLFIVKMHRIRHLEIQAPFYTCYFFRKTLIGTTGHFLKFNSCIITNHLCHLEGKVIFDIEEIFPILLLV